LVDLDTSVGHRRLLDPAPGLRPLENGELYERIGGRATVERLVEALYARFETDKVIRSFFGRNFSAERERQKVFFAEWLGGSSGYSESAWGALHRHHEDLPISEEVATRWLGHLSGALSDTVTDDRDAGMIIERARGVAFALVNYYQDPAAGGPGASRHRSAQIATCGIGARTLKRATLAAQGGKVAALAELASEIPDLLEHPPYAGRLLLRGALSGRREVVEWLLHQGVDVNKPSTLGVSMIGGAFELVFFVTPLCAARLTRHSEMASYLLSRGARDDIFTAAFLGDVSSVRQSLTRQPGLAQVADPATDVLTITPIHHAVGGNQLPTLRVLLEHTSEPVRTGARALRGAIGRGKREMVELLLKHGADAGALGAGGWVLDPAIAPRLAAAGASAGVGTSGQASGDWVRISCTGNQGRKDNPGFVSALLHYGARVDQRYNGATALHYAVKAGFAQTIRVLLEHGADPDAHDDRGRAPLDWLGQAAKSVDRAAVRDVLKSAAGGE
jgi:truncated hemoglobin YjbI/ankyrin repeat protein